MNNVVEFLTSKEVVVVYILAVIASILAFLIYFIDKKLQKRKQKNNTKELNRLVEQVVDKLEEQKKETVQPEQVQKEVVAVPVTPVETETSPIPVVKTTQSVTPTVEVVTTPIPEPAEAIEVKTEPNRIVPEKIIEPITEKQPLIETPEIIVKKEEVVENLEEVPIENLILDEINQGMDDSVTKSEQKKEIVSEIIQEEETQVEEIIEYGDNEPDQTTAQAELEKLTEELKNAEKTTNIDLTDFELKQEENAIISLDELMSKGNTLYEKNEETQYSDEGNEPISIQDLEQRMKAIREETKALTMEKLTETIEVLDDIEPIVTEIETIQPEVVPVHETAGAKVHLDDFHSIKDTMKIPINTYQKTKNFKSSPIISPIYGIKDSVSLNTEMELENTSNYEKLDEEIRKTNEFLMTLKELQKKLD